MRSISNSDVTGADVVIMTSAVTLIKTPALGLQRLIDYNRLLN